MDIHQKLVAAIAADQVVEAKRLIRSGVDLNIPSAQGEKTKGVRPAICDSQSHSELQLRRSRKTTTARPLSAAISAARRARMRRGSVTTRGVN